MNNYFSIDSNFIPTNESTGVAQNTGRKRPLESNSPSSLTEKVQKTANKELSSSSIASSFSLHDFDDPNYDPFAPFIDEFVQSSLPQENLPNTYLTRSFATLISQFEASVWSPKQEELASIDDLIPEGSVTLDPLWDEDSFDNQMRQIEEKEHHATKQSLPQTFSQITTTPVPHKTEPQGTSLLDGTNFEDSEVIRFSKLIPGYKNFSKGLVSLPLTSQAQIIIKEFNSRGSVQQLTELSLTGENLFYLSPDFSLPNLRRINLSINSIGNPPAWIFTASLRRLNLDYTGLTEVPEAIGNSVLLTHLSLSGNPITKFPASMEKLKRLISLDLSYCLLEQLPAEIFDSPNLRTFNAANNRLSTLNWEVGNLLQLETLTLDNNDLESLPSSLWGLEYLTELSLRGNPIAGSYTPDIIRKHLDTSFDLTVKRWKDEVHVLTDFCKLLPGGNELLTKIKSFDPISRSQYMEMWIRKDNHLQKKLTILDLSNKGLTALPTQVWLPNLIKIDLSNNKLKTLPEWVFVPQLRYLDFSNNLIKDVSLAILKCTNLHKLGVKGNSVNQITLDYIVSMFKNNRVNENNLITQKAAK